MNYCKIYNSLISRRKSNPAIGYTEKHHILPRSLGGSNDSENIVVLTAREHFIAHLLLLKMQQPNTYNYYKMLTAFMMMLTCSSENQQRVAPSKRYEKLRTEYAEFRRYSTAGDRNPMFDKLWISNPDLKLSKRISKHVIPEDGWYLGRNLKWKFCKNCNGKFLQRKNLCCSKECANKIISEAVVEQNKVVSKKYKNGYTVSVDGVEYVSISKAADALGIGHETARMRFKSKNFPNYQIIDKN